jgi:hypothetical protein
VTLFDATELTGWSVAGDRVEELLDVILEVKAHATANVRAQAAAGDRVWLRHLAETVFDAGVEADTERLAHPRPVRCRRTRP